jgi:homoserine dehydrogenase
MDFEYSNRLGCTIRQISRAEIDKGELRAAVEPALVAIDSPLAKVSGSQNLVMSTGEFGGETVFSGYGAGGNPTAVAVVSDLLYVVRSQLQLATEPDRPRPRRFEVSSDFVAARYLRFVVRDAAGIIASLASVLAKNGLNIDSILQMPGHPKAALPFVITLEPCGTNDLEAAMEEINEFEFLAETPLNMPILR